MGAETPVARATGVSALMAPTEVGPTRPPDRPTGWSILPRNLRPGVAPCGRRASRRPVSPGSGSAESGDLAPARILDLIAACDETGIPQSHLAPARPMTPHPSGRSGFGRPLLSQQSQGAPDRGTAARPLQSVKRLRLGDLREICKSHWRISASRLARWAGGSRLDGSSVEHVVPRGCRASVMVCPWVGLSGTPRADQRR